MRDLRRWILVGLAVAVVSVAAVGYALIASDIATPPSGNLGTLAVPDDVEPVTPVYLADGRPAFVVLTSEAVYVIDARPPIERGAPGRLVVWCGGAFVDLVGTGLYLPHGALIGGAPSGLIVYPATVTGDGRGVVVGADGRTSEAPPRPDRSVDCDAVDAVMHAPTEDEVFDPSVAANEEPPGWVWLEGRLVEVGGQALLCDGDGIDCPSGAVVRGIDPAKVPPQPVQLAGLFLGRVSDGGIDELHYVPLREAGR